MKCMVRKCMTRKGLLASTGWTHELLWRLFEALLLITVRKRSLRRLSFHRCLSVQWEGCPGPGQRGSAYGGCPGPGPRGGVSQHALRQTPLQQTATAADGTHPTGMHSCYQIFSC